MLLQMNRSTRSGPANRHAWPVALLLLAAAASAQQQSVPRAVALDTEAEDIREYSVEMIIFEYAGTAADSTEIFEPEPPAAPVYEDDLLTGFPAPSEQQPETVAEPVEDSAGDLQRPAPADEELAEIPTFEQAGLRVLGPQDFQMTRTWDRLVRLDAYRPLMHTAWIQPTIEQDQTAAIRLRRLGNPPLRLDGTVSLYLSRFLHLVVDLSLEDKKPLRPTATRERIRRYDDNRNYPSMSFDADLMTPSLVYRIQEDRIFRNNEVRYYDHPKFGVIARITRIEEEAPDTLDTTGDLLPGPGN